MKSTGSMAVPVMQVRIVGMGMAHSLMTAPRGARLGDGFELIEPRRHTHATPWGSPQSFQFSAFQFR
jgi:hypothetical protein